MTGHCTSCNTAPDQPTPAEAPDAAAERIAAIRANLQTETAAEWHDALHNAYLADVPWLLAELDRLTTALRDADWCTGNEARERGIAERREANIKKSIAQIVSFMQDAPELWGNPAADRAITRLTHLAAPDCADQEGLTDE